MANVHTGGVPRRFSTGLRARATIAFGLTGLLVAAAAAVLTYTVGRADLIEEREDAAKHQAFVNARLARTVLRAERPDVRAFLASLGGSSASESFLRFRGETFATSVAVAPDVLPRDLVRLVADTHVGHKRYRDSSDALRLAVGVPLPAVEAEYYEVFSLAELQRTLDLLRWSLAVGVAGAALVAAITGRLAASRLVRPLRPVADAAERIAAGALDTRLDDQTDPDLRRLTQAFNGMAAALEARVQREARFAADVSHELRSPLTAVSAAIEIINRRRTQFSPEVIQAFEVLSEKVELFQQMVLDLLEISRVDAGTASVADDVIDVQHLLDRLSALHHADDAVIEIDHAPARIRGDRRRLAQALGNMFDNANRYAGGVKRITASAPRPGWLRLDLDDAGPGVPLEERDAVFGRFARGEAGVAAGSTSGTGLGLALSAEHIRLHGGHVWIEDAPIGGARFVVQLPVGDL